MPLAGTIFAVVFGCTYYESNRPSTFVTVASEAKTSSKVSPSYS